VTLKAGQQSGAASGSQRADFATKGSTKLKRGIDLAAKAWRYGLSIAERPRDVAFFAAGLARGAHLGELIKLCDLRLWLNGIGVRTVIDVGAHTGEFASAARVVLPDARIYSFEPLPDRHSQLVKRFQGDARFLSFCVCLGDANGEVTFWRSSFSKSSSALPMAELHKRAFPWSASSTELRVPVRTLDDYQDTIAANPKVLLKIDTQGFEDRVIRGARKLLENVHLVIVETSYAPLYEGQASFDNVYMQLRSAGFEYRGAVDQLISPLDGSILQGDALFSKGV